MVINIKSNTVMNIKNIKLSLGITLLAMAGMTSCSDQPDAYETTGGTPSISYIRLADAASKDSLLTGAFQDTPICIVGNNLRSIVAMNFNDRPAVLNTSYMTDNTILLTVPKDIPDVVTDKIYMITTSNDTVAYDFKVLINPPTVLSMENEQAKAGEEGVIKGNYFLDYPDFPLTVEFPNNYVLPREYITSISMTEIRFTVPADAPAGFIKVKTKYGTTRSNFQFHDQRGILFDFDTPNPVSNVVLGNHGWHAMKIQADENSLSGNYLLLGDTDMTADGAWNDGAFSFEYWAGDWNGGFSGDGVKLSDIVDFTDFENMSLKFEICIPENGAWAAAPMQLIFAGPDKVTISTANNVFFHADDGWGRAIYAPWKGTGAYHTGGKWTTVTLPLGGDNGVFNKYWDGTAASAKPSKPEDFASLTIFCVNGGGYEGEDCHPIIRIDNIRAVPNK